MSHPTIINAVAVTMLRNPVNCATLTPTLGNTIRVQDRCRNNRTTRPAATPTALQEV
jgi:hypothetical protein